MASGDLETWMWAQACEMLERAERMQRQFFQPGSRPQRRPVWQPPVDVFETEHALWVVIALPGVSPERIQVSFQGGILTVAGERRLPVEAEAAVRRLEIPHGYFERRMELPPGRYELDRHELANGCLYISLRKS